MSISKGVHEVTIAEIRHLGKHHGQQGVRGNVERNAKKNIGASLIQLARQLSVAYIKNDMGGAWSRDDFGNWEFPCTPGGETQREYSFRMGINLIMYALCLDYKADQVHVDFIMKRRPWRPNDGAEIPE